MILSYFDVHVFINNSPLQVKANYTIKSKIKDKSSSYHCIPCQSFKCRFFMCKRTMIKKYDFQDIL